MQQIDLAGELRGAEMRDVGVVHGVFSELIECVSPVVLLFVEGVEARVEVGVGTELGWGHEAEDSALLGGFPGGVGEAHEECAET